MPLCQAAGPGQQGTQESKGTLCFSSLAMTGGSPRLETLSGLCLLTNDDRDSGVSQHDLRSPITSS